MHISRGNEAGHLVEVQYSCTGCDEHRSRHKAHIGKARCPEQFQHPSCITSDRSSDICTAALSTVSLSMLLLIMVWVQEA